MHYLDSSGGGEPSLDCFITIPGIRAGMEPGRLRILRGRGAFRLTAGDALAVAVSRIDTAAFRRAATIYAGPCGLSDPAVDDGDSIAKRASMPVAIDALTAPAVFDGARFGLAAWAMPSKFIPGCRAGAAPFERHPCGGRDPVTSAFAFVTLWN